MNHNFIQTLKQLKDEITPIETNLKPSGMIETEIKAILFDIYGTTFISDIGDLNILERNSLHENLTKLFEQYTINEKPKNVIKQLHKAIEKEQKKLKNSGIDYPEVNIINIWMDVLEIHEEDFIRHFALDFEILINPVFPMPGLEKVLGKCHDKHLEMGIISNAQFYTPLLFNAFLDKTLEELGFNENLVFLSYKYNHAKPSNFLYEKAKNELNQYDIKPENTLYIGNDKLYDILPASKIGFKTALFAGDQRSLRLREDIEECKNLTPDLIITDLKQILNHV